MLPAISQGQDQPTKKETKVRKPGKRKKVKSNAKQKRSVKQRARKGENAHKGDITGRSVRKKNKKSPRPSFSGVADPDPYAGRKRQKERDRAKPRQVQPSSASKRGERSGNTRYTRSPNYRPKAKKSKTYNRSSPYAGRKERKERDRSYSNAPQLGGIRSVSGNDKGKKKRRRVSPRTSSQPYLTRRKGRYGKKSAGGERAHKGDLIGRRKKTKRSEPRVITRPTANPYYGRKNRGKDKGYQGAANIARSEPNYKDRAWKGSISGGSVRNRNTSTKNRAVHGATSPYLKNKRGTGDKANKRALKNSRGNQSVSGYKRSNRALSKRNSPAPTASAGFQGKLKSRGKMKGAGGSVSGKGWNNGGNATTQAKYSQNGRNSAAFRGKRKQYKPLKGGGSVSGKTWNNSGRATTQGRYSQNGRNSAAFRGKSKQYKPLKGGGSVSGKTWNNGGRATTQAKYSQNGRNSSGFRGKQKQYKPLKGGGSISGKTWNNGGAATTRRNYSQNGRNSASFRGKQKQYKPLRGGGSISGKRWNNGGQALRKKTVANPAAHYSTTKFSGFRKGAKKPMKGGGSVSRKGWNNSGQAMRRNEPSNNQKRGASFQGNLKGGKPQKGGGSVSRLGWNNNRQALRRKDQSRTGRVSASYQGKTKHMKPLKGAGGSLSRANWNNDEQPLKKKSVNPETYFAARYQGQLKSRKKPIKGGGSISRASWNNNGKPLNKKDPGSVHDKAMHSMGRFKDKRKRKLAPNVDKKALMAVHPQKHYYDEAKYTGTIKIKKRKVNDSHPSYRYTGSHKKENGKEAKEKTFKFKIWWAKLFKKNESQPEVLKEKTRTPRYDKREKDLWNE